MEAKSVRPHICGVSRVLASGKILSFHCVVDDVSILGCDCVLLDVLFLKSRDSVVVSHLQDFKCPLRMLGNRWMHECRGMV